MKDLGTLKLSVQFAFAEGPDGIEVTWTVVRPGSRRINVGTTDDFDSALNGVRGDVEKELATFIEELDDGTSVL